MTARIGVVTWWILSLGAVLVHSVADTEPSLQLVEIVWRNGDRNPTELCPADTNTEESFYQGFQYLTTLGMQQHFELGQRIFREYAENSNFLLKFYDPRQVYVRSADTNRTMLSAASNMVGMYSNGTQQKSLDFPDIPEWPTKFVPVSIHSDKPEIDYESEMAPCPRRDYLWSTLKDATEYKKLDERYNATLNSVSQKCGRQIDLFNLDIITKSFAAERKLNLSVLFTDDEYSQLKEAEEIMDDLKRGLGMQCSDDVNYCKEITLLRFGSLLKRIFNYFELKMLCTENSSNENCEWMNKLKYYAFSVHGTTMNGLLNVVLRNATEADRKTTVQSAFATAFELWRTGSNSYSIKVKKFTDDTVMDITKSIPGCNEYCAYDSLASALSGFIPENIEERCKIDTPTPSATAITTTSTATTNASPQTTDKLVFIQAFWRHGDRSPLSGCENDKNNESVWHLGSGELSPIGMHQHYLKGRIIYDRYVTQKGFLSKTYNAKEIYAHSTGFNRTVISATCNLIGMYSTREGVIAGKDYPDIPGWPKGYVPIPVHNYDNTHDHMGDPNTPCPRQAYFVDLAENAPEVLNYEKEMKGVLDEASQLCGHQLTLFSITRPLDANLIEGLYNYPQLFNSTLHARLQEMEGVAENVKHGLLAYNYIQNGYNLKVEIPRTRGGSALWNAIDHMALKIKCINDKDAEDCRWMNGLKYFIFSGHDSTVDAVLTTLGMKERVVPGGIPDYTATIMFELYQTADNNFAVKVMYHRSFDALEWEDVTGYITGCPNNERCTFDKFSKRSMQFHPEDITTLCNNVPITPTGTAHPTGTSRKPETTTSAAFSLQSGFATVILMALTALILPV